MVAASMAFKMYGAFLSFIFSVAALSAFPSITICSSLVLRILPIQSVNARDSSSSSIPQVILENVESDGMPFFSFSWFLFAHFTIRRREVFPARNPTTMSNRISTWLSFQLCRHKISTALKNPNSFTVASVSVTFFLSDLRTPSGVITPI